MSVRYWEEITHGEQFTTGTISVSASDIIDFASQFDPQPYHLDPVVGEQSIFGGHCASGWQICALMMRLFVDSMSNEGIASIGSSEVSSLRWLKPVLADDVLSGTIVVESLQPDSPHTGYGSLNCVIDVFNQSNVKVITLHTDMMVQKRPTEPIDPESAGPQTVGPQTVRVR